MHKNRAKSQATATHETYPSPTHRPPRGGSQVVEGAPPSLQNISKRDSTLMLIRHDNPGEAIQIPIDPKIGMPTKLFVELTEDNLRSLHEVLTAWLYGAREDV